MDLQYSNINLDDTTESILEETLKQDYKLYQQMIAKISSLKKADKKFNNEEPGNTKDICEIKGIDIIKSDIDKEFEEEVNYYYFRVKNVTTSDLESNLIIALPSKENYQYEKILLRICAEIMSNVKLMRDLLNNEDVSNDDILVFSTDISIELEKVRMIKKLLKEEKKEFCTEHVIKNNIVLVPALNGNMRIIEDITKIPHDYYSRFHVLIKSIENGTFKGVKRFYTEGLNGLCEVRFFNTRVLFCQLNKNTYGIIGAFVKKTTSDTYYNSMINNYNLLYKSSLNTLISKLSDSKFMKLQAEYYKELFDILEPQSDIEKGKQYERNIRVTSK